VKRVWKIEAREWEAREGPTVRGRTMGGDVESCWPEDFVALTVDGEAPVAMLKGAESREGEKKGAIGGWRVPGRDLGVAVCSGAVVEDGKASQRAERGRCAGVGKGRRRRGVVSR
jgi:hypothetical protein